MLGGDFFKHVEGDGVIQIGGIEINHVLNAVLGNPAKHLFGRVAVRIDVADTVAFLNIGVRQILEEGRFAHPRLPDRVNVSATVISLNAKNLHLISKIRFREWRNVAGSYLDWLVRRLM